MNKKRQVGLVFLCTVLASILASYVVEGLRTIVDNSFLLMLVNQAILVLPSVLYIVASRMNLKDAIRLKKISSSNVVLCIIFSFLIMPLMNLINAISLLFSQNMIQAAISDIVDNNMLFLSVFVIALLPCVFEETIFRGVLYNEYRKSNVRIGIFLSAFLFGLMHQNFNQFSYAFAMGIVFAMLIEATDSIVSTMIVHFIINANSVIMTYLLPKLLDAIEKVGSKVEGYESVADTVVTKETILSNMGYYVVSAIIASVLAYIVYKTIAQNANRWEYVKSIFSKKARERMKDSNETLGLEVTEEEHGGIFTVSLMVGIILCLGLMVLTEIYVAQNGL
ncbi:CPBP family intramembrane glutamic endopeptidase [Anaerosporobacter sp.]|uniref:CPBP family intramembrane glutamic endopeptidase n=1 Tax=Anaerosporobacter sp. TaxID=1872529 RepID=UPI00286ECA66|nr:type II CAAX endopeptidase family protein [Anaerosporobacter sp.]